MEPMARSDGGGRYVKACPGELARWIDETLGGPNKRGGVINRAGLSRTTFNNWASGKNRVTPKSLEPFAKALNRGIEEIEAEVQRRRAWGRCCQADEDRPCPFASDDGASKQSSDPRLSTPRRMDEISIPDPMAAARPSVTVTDPGWDHEPWPSMRAPFPGLEPYAMQGQARPQLIISGQRQGADVVWTYRVGRGSEPFLERTVAWDASLDGFHEALGKADSAKLQALGLKLGPLLLGALGDPQHHQICRTVFEMPDGELTTPWAGAVRCRLLLDEPLAALPWRLAALLDRNDERYWLVDAGWTFELGSPALSSRRVRLRSPCSVLFVVPQHGTRQVAGAALVERATEHLEALWPSHRRQMARHVGCVHSPVELRRAIAGGSPPDLVIIFGRVSAVSEPRVVFEHGKGIDSHAEREPLAALLEDLAAAEVKLVYLATPNAVDLPPGGTCPPCLIAPTLSSSSRDAVETCLSWLRAMLAKGLDPVRAMHGSPPNGPSMHWSTLCAHTDFEHWSTAPATAESADQRARHTIDRDTPRSVFMRHVDRLVKHEVRRVEAFVAHGGPQDRVEWLSDQFHREYKDREPTWRAFRLQVDFPSGSGGTAADTRPFEHAVLDALEIDDDDESLSWAVSKIAERHRACDEPFVLWLDWEPRPKGVAASALAAWMKVAADMLPTLTEGLDNVRVVSTLGVVPANPREFSADARSLANGIKNPMVSVTVLAALGVVTGEHLDHYLSELSSGCPPELVQAVSDVIMARTGGAFSAVVELVETIEHGNGWRSLVTQRVTQPPTTIEPDKIL